MIPHASTFADARNLPSDVELVQAHGDRGRHHRK
jgi:hypothetical protein